MKKIFLTFILVACSLSLPNSVLAAVVTVNPQGEIVWQVLGEETSSLEIPTKPDISVKNVSETLSLSKENGKIILNTMDVTNTSGDLVEIEARADSNNIKISKNSDQFMIEENGVKALTSFPITIDPVRNEISVETASGSRLISILPHEVAITLMRNKLIDNINENGMVLNESTKGELEYIIKGTKNINLFNVLDIKADIASNVSASNGEVLEIEEPQWLKFFGFIFKS